MIQKLIVILGPTSSGKSDLAVILAKQFNGEIISADSRQIYKGLNIGSGKITKKEMAGVPHHLLDVASPKQRFTVAQFQKLARKKILQIQGRSKLPFLVGGTGFYIQAIVDGLVLPDVKPNTRLRLQLSKKSPARLFAMLKNLDPARATTIDRHNPRRLIRAIEIVKATGKPVPTPSQTQVCKDVLQIGIKLPAKILKDNIRKRLLKRLQQGMVAEVKRLHEQGLPWRRLEELGLEYRFVARLQRYARRQDCRQAVGLAQHCGQAQYQAKKKEIITNLEKEINRYAKRQMTWFKRDKRIHWIKSQGEAKKLIQNFI